MTILSSNEQFLIECYRKIINEPQSPSSSAIDQTFINKLNLMLVEKFNIKSTVYQKEFQYSSQLLKFLNLPENINIVVVGITGVSPYNNNGEGFTLYYKKF